MTLTPLDEFTGLWAEGRYDEARRMAGMFVDAHAEAFAVLAPYSREELVAMVEWARDAGDEQTRILLDMWLLARFEPVAIVGTLALGPVVLAQAIMDAAERSAW